MGGNPAFYLLGDGAPALTFRERARPGLSKSRCRFTVRFRHERTGRTTLGYGRPRCRCFLARRLSELLHGEAVTVIDLRGPEAFGGAHMTGAVNIGAGAVLPIKVTSIVSFGPMSAHTGLLCRAISFKTCTLTKL